MNIRTVLVDSYNFYFGNIKQIALVCLPILFVALFSQYLLFAIPEFEAAPFVSLGLELIFYPVYTAAIIMLIAKISGREEINNHELITRSLKIWFPFFLLTLMMGFLVGVGLILLIAPGIWLVIRLSFSEIFLVVGDLKPVDAIRASFNATKEYFWIIFISIVIVTLLIWAINFSLGKMYGLIPDSTVLGFGIEILISFAYLFVNVVIFRIFMLAGVEQTAA